MNKYTVKSGQNIFDIAVQLHGTVEGIFDLLVSNVDISLNTPLRTGMQLDYNEDFMLNQGIVNWLIENGITVKNGHHTCGKADIKDIVRLYLSTYQVEEWERLNNLTVADKQKELDSMSRQRVHIKQRGMLCSVGFWIQSGYMVVDWGDYTAPQVFGPDNEQEIEHCYKSAGEHEIKIYGNFSLYHLDFTALNGVYYLLEPIICQHFVGLDINELNTLITK